MKNLINFINSHDGCLVESVNGKTLTVSCYCTFNGVCSRVSETIPATLTAARNWLGY